MRTNAPATGLRTDSPATATQSKKALSRDARGQFAPKQVPSPFPRCGCWYIDLSRFPSADAFTASPSGRTGRLKVPRRYIINACGYQLEVRHMVGGGFLMTVPPEEDLWAETDVCFRAHRLSLDLLALLRHARRNNVDLLLVTCVEEDDEE
ncbi:hypothetical protein [Alienimonas sp. DA493]|uniref:hypothetical protein n=1 Tax=Alienimonas sp. DA493 TaxID=3373605 RepID=UPI0037547068